MRKLFLFLFILSVSSICAQYKVVTLPEFPNYFNKTIDTLKYYKNGGKLKGNVKEMHKLMNSSRVTTKYFNKKREPITGFGKKLYRIESKNDSIKEIYFLETNPKAVYSYRKVDKNNYYLGQIVTYDSQNRIRSFRKINDDLSEEYFQYKYTQDHKLLSITEKAFLTVEVPLEDGTGIREIRLIQEPTYIRKTKANYKSGRLVEISSTEEDEYNENIIHKNLSFHYYSRAKVREVLLTSYQINKKSGKKDGQTAQKQFRLFYNVDSSIKETILNYHNKQEGYIKVVTDYRQNQARGFETIRITTIGKEDENSKNEDKLIENISIKRDAKQNIIEVTNTTNQNWNEKITFTYKYY